MRFMMLMIPGGYANAKPDAMPDAKAVEEMMKYNTALKEAGILLALDGLHPPSDGVRVSFKNGKVVTEKGPFRNTSETLGGYWMIQVGSKDEAVRWASRCPASDGDIIELRQVQEMDEFPEDVKDAAKDFSL